MVRKIKGENMKKQITKQAFVTSDDSCYSGIEVHPWKKGMRYNSTQDRIFSTRIYLYTQYLETIFGIFLKDGYAQKALITYFPNNRGFSLKLVGKPFQPKLKEDG